MNTVDREACYRIAPGHRMQWEEAQQAWVILYPEGMVRLNESAAEILRRCDGDTPLNAVIEGLAAAFDDPDLAADVIELVGAALAQGWLQREGTG